MTKLPTVAAEKPLPITTTDYGLWTYECLPASGTCRLDGVGVLRVQVTFSKYLNAFPDVRDIEAWLADLLEVPTTVEEIAQAAWKKWGMAVMVVGRSDRHGPITIRMPYDMPGFGRPS